MLSTSTSPEKGPTKILPFLFLGSEADSQDEDLLKELDIRYQLNVSTTCSKSPFIPESNFMRIAVTDTVFENLLSSFDRIFQFLERVRKESNGSVLIHCQAGISRSATVVIAYIMRYLAMSREDAYRFVKDKRPCISPNFSFVNQLDQFEDRLRQEDLLPPKSASVMSSFRLILTILPESPSDLSSSSRMQHLNLPLKCTTTMMATSTDSSYCSPRRKLMQIIPSPNDSTTF